MAAAAANAATASAATTAATTAAATGLATAIATTAIATDGHAISDGAAATADGSSGRLSETADGSPEPTTKAAAKGESAGCC